MTYVKTAESVSSGHPDKIADQISDLVLDQYLKRDPNVRVACETVVKTGLVFLVGEISSSFRLSESELIQSIRDLILSIGYSKEDYGFHGHSCSIIHALSAQSSDISQSVENEDQKKLGAGDQGVMIGYACRETEEFMPATIMFAKKCLRVLDDARLKVGFLGPDAKCQVSIAYNEKKQIDHIVQVTLSTMHDESLSVQELREFLEHEVVRKALPTSCLKDQTKFFLNPSGRFVIGGPQSDAGLTGRKIVVDSYGPGIPHGGGAFSGKDPTKVDRSGAYLTRWIAKHLVAAEICDEALVEIAFAIGYSQPVALNVKLSNSFYEEKDLLELIKTIFPLSPGRIIRELNLTSSEHVSYLETAQKGHFGVSSYPWEQLSHLDVLKQSLSSLKKK
jgi:S-adenosylmethionine synthetase